MQVLVTFGCGCAISVPFEVQCCASAYMQLASCAIHVCSLFGHMQLLCHLECSAAQVLFGLAPSAVTAISFKECLLPRKRGFCKCMGAMLVNHNDPYIQRGYCPFVVAY